MKSLKYCIVALATLVFAACGKNGTITTSTTKIQGPLGKYFEVVDKEYKAKDGKICVEVKRIETGFPSPWNESMEVGYWDGYFEPHFTIEFQDGDGMVTSKDQTDIVLDEDELVAIAELGVEETASITFEIDDAAVSFKMGSTFKTHGEKQAEEEKEEDYSWLSKRLVTDEDLEGLSKEELRIYRNAIYAMHGYKFKSADLQEYFGKFDWYTPSKADVSSELNSIETSNVTFIQAAEANAPSGVESSYDYSSSSGSEDWDALLDSYDSYVTKYVSYVKKAANGDMSALSEYPALMEKAQEFSNKMSGAQGQMTSAQWSRYMKITNKMANAAGM